MGNAFVNLTPVSYGPWLRPARIRVLEAALLLGMESSRLAQSCPSAE